MAPFRLVSAALALAAVALGVAMLVITFSRGGGPLATGVLLGVMFVLGGGLRLYILRKGL